MATFLLVYRVPEGGQPEASPEVATAWQSYLDSVGSRMLDAGNPVFQRTVVGGGPNETVLGGYSLVEADSLEAASKMAQGVPFLAVGGAVEVGELTTLDVENIVTSASDHARATNLEP